MNALSVVESLEWSMDDGIGFQSILAASPRARNCADVTS
jgi:hypothetical protein